MPFRPSCPGVVGRGAVIRRTSASCSASDEPKLDATPPPTQAIRSHHPRRLGATHQRWGPYTPTTPQRRCPARALLKLYAEKGDPKYERASLKYLRRYLEEADPWLADVAGVAALLAERAMLMRGL